MQRFELLRQPLMGELAMSPERKREREKNATCSAHLRLCQQPRAAHALRSDQLHHILYLNVMVQSTMKYKLRNQHCLRFLLFPAILMFGLCLAWWFLSSQMLYLLSPLLFITLSAGVISPNIIDCKCFFPELCDSEEWVCGLCPQGAPLLVSPFVPSSLCLNSPTTIQSFTSLEGGRVAVDPLPCPWSSWPQI